MIPELCNNVTNEPHFHPLSGEALHFKTANWEFNARFDNAAYGFWRGRFEHSYFDVRVFNPSAPSNPPFKSGYHCHEREKRHQYEQCVHETEHDHFIPLAFITTRGMGGAASKVYKRLANLLTEKLDLSYGEAMGWIRCKLSFDLVRLAVMCICGTCSWMHSPVIDTPVDVQIAEAHL